MSAPVPRRVYTWHFHPDTLPDVRRILVAIPEVQRVTGAPLGGLARLAAGVATGEHALAEDPETGPDRVWIESGPNDGLGLDFGGRLRQQIDGAAAQLLDEIEARR